jgi:copper resistance protein B
MSNAQGLPFRLGIVALLTLLRVGGAEPLAAQEFDNAVFHFSQLEVDAGRTSGLTDSRWSGSGWIGNDFDRVWWSTEGERLGGSVGAAETTALYGHYFRRFWDVVVGYRQDIKPVAQGYLTLGLMGLAPYWFEVGVFGYVSHKGRPSMRLEADTDLYLTQRWVLTPKGEATWLILSDDAMDMDAGVSDLDVGLQARFEIRRKFAPYMELSWVHEQDARIPDPNEIGGDGFRFGLGLRLIY